MKTGETQVRRNVIAWMRAITGMSSLIGDRISSGEPMEAGPTLPFAVVTLSHAPSSDLPACAWRGTLTLSIRGSTSDQIGAVEDLLIDELSPGDVATELTDDEILVSAFQLEGVIGGDAAVVSFEGDRYLFLTRDLNFGVTWVWKETP